MARRLRRQLPVLALLTAGLLYPRLLPGDYFLHLGLIVSLYIILTSSLNLVMGITGQFAVAHAAFYGVGAYGSILLVTRLGVPYWAAWLLGILLAGCLAFLIGLATLHLKGAYLAICTFAFSELFRLLLDNWVSLTNGANGIIIRFVPPPLGIPGLLKAARETGYPIVLKGVVEGQVHKTELGLVKLNLRNRDEVKSAFRKMVRAKIKPKSFLIQPMLRGDLELIAGVVRDPQFGPAVMVGLGGVRAEVYKDVAFRLAPLNQKDVLSMVSDLEGQALLKGYRGSKPVNMESLANWLIKLGGLALKFEKIQEIDVNPLLVLDGEPVAVDANMILR